MGWQDNPARLAGLSRRIIKKEMAVTKKEGIKIILAMRQMVGVSEGRGKTLGQRF